MRIVIALTLTAIAAVAAVVLWRGARIEGHTAASHRCGVTSVDKMQQPRLTRGAALCESSLPSRLPMPLALCGGVCVPDATLQQVIVTG